MAEVAMPMPTPPPSGLNGDAAIDSSNENAPPATSNTENITVFHDPENFNVKHPLQNTWTLWFTKPPSGRVRNLRL
jgi:translation initiation factor 4E